MYITVLHVSNCHHINGPGITGPGGTLMTTQMVPSDHLCTDISDPGKT